MHRAPKCPLPMGATKITVCKSGFPDLHQTCIRLGLASDLLGLASSSGFASGPELSKFEIFHGVPPLEIDSGNFWSIYKRNPPIKLLVNFIFLTLFALLPRSVCKSDCKS